MSKDKRVGCCPVRDRRHESSGTRPARRRLQAGEPRVPQRQAVGEQLELIGRGQETWQNSAMFFSCVGIVLLFLNVVNCLK